MGRQLHFEPFVHLVDVGPDRALVAWGGFWFARDDPAGRWRVVGDGHLDEVDPGRTSSIGAGSEPYGRADVEVLDDGGAVVARATTAEANSVWVEGLSPDTRYRYRVAVDGRPWADGERWDWGPVPRGGLDLRPGGRAYDFAFRTHPALDRPAPLDFAVLGDFGVGIVADTEAGRRQRRVAEVLDRLVDRPGIRLVLTVGDNVYATPGRRGSEGSGDSDDDWYGSFYQPYRYALARIPVYPTVGNHDTADQESSDDRARIRDNFHTDARFTPDVAGARASVDPGMFYRLAFGADVEFLCIDTSLSRDLPTEHFFEHPRHHRFLADALPEADGPRWRIPFSHHPAYCAGPHHPNTAAMVEHLVPLFWRAGVRVAFAGHEHNFQLSRVDGIDYVVSGAGGQLQEEPPTGFAEAGTVAWAAQAHLLLVRIDGVEMTLTPVAAIERDGELEPMTLRTPEGRLVEVPVPVRAD
ncbi:metallophosphoesterase family protein [Geodermatophilus sp. DF01-2]|uniref:purple acid phosphatase family protein n=1 Tax=Geodermatophilus sp. DF01-2 TaxID=2559610 RepID=UPI001074231B|nr:metallophosphoesterase family protein [Geodermatophilus sp. DF01_2]TFV63980.1 metallophosphoesterase family protein [Geodermatophilus sp. DF01_2]